MPPRLTRGARTITSVCEDAGVARSTATNWLPRCGLVTAPPHHEVPCNGRRRPRGRLSWRRQGEPRTREACLGGAWAGSPLRAWAGGQRAVRLLRPGRRLHTMRVRSPFACARVRCCETIPPGGRVRVAHAPPKNRRDLGEPPRGRNVTGSDRSAVLARVAEAVAPGARQHTAWERVGGAARTR